MASTGKLQSVLSTFEGFSAPVNARNADVPLSQQNVITAFYVSSTGEPNATSPFDAKSVLDEGVKSTVLKYVSDMKVVLKPGSARTFFWPADALPYKSLSLAAVPEDRSVDAEDYVNKCKEKVREAYSSCVKNLQDLKETEILLDDTADMLTASEACHLMSWNFDMYKSTQYRKQTVNLDLLNSNSAVSAEYQEGFYLADTQNLARTLMEMPSNRLTPVLFAEQLKKVVDSLRSSSDMKVEVIARDEKWLKAEKMGGFLGVAQGSVEMPRLLEIHVTHPEASEESIKNPLVLVGKGITFDAGGISIKGAAKMGAMRADMGGAAVMSSTAVGAMRLRPKGKLICLCGLAENMPSGSAYKPADVITTRSGLTIEVDNTDAEGRVVLSDVLDYAQTFNPSSVIDAATLTGAMVVSLGACYTGAFCRTTKMFELLRKVGYETGDQVWRMPLADLYNSQVTNSALADVINTAKAPGPGGACTAAAFLSQFAKFPEWGHLDIAGVMENKDEVKYLPKGMSGRPTRTLIQYTREYFTQ